MEPLTCKRCTAPIPAENILNDGRLAVCKFCDTVHHLDQDLIPFPEKPKRDKKKRQMPEKFIIEQHPDGVEVIYRWLGKQHWAMLLFAVFWNGFLFVWVMISLSMGAYFMILFAGIHIAIGVGIGYYVLSGFLNRTSIMIRDSALEIIHRPLPVFGMKDQVIERQKIEQAYCKRRVAYTSNDVPVYVFDVHYLDEYEEEQTLVKGLDMLSKALFIEQQIERIYAIDDEPVEGEYTRR